jgi:hypothetical protein
MLFISSVKSLGLNGTLDLITLDLITHFMMVSYIYM